MKVHTRNPLLVSRKPTSKNNKPRTSEQPAEIRDELVFSKDIKNSNSGEKQWNWDNALESAKVIAARATLVAVGAMVGAFSAVPLFGAIGHSVGVGLPKHEFARPKEVPLARACGYLGLAAQAFGCTALVVSGFPAAIPALAISSLAAAVPFLHTAVASHPKDVFLDF